MGFWQGVAQGFREDKEAAIRKQEIEEGRAFEREMFKEKLKADVQTTLLQRRLERGASGKEASKMAAVMKPLQSIGLNQKLIDQIVATGDVASATALASTVASEYKKAVAAGRETEYMQLLNDNLSGGTYTPATASKIFNDVNERLIGDLSAEELGLSDEEFITPGTMVVKPPLMPENPDLGTVETANKMVIGYATNAATRDLRNLESTMNVIDTQITELSKNNDQVSRDKIASLEYLKNATIERYNTVGSAVEASKDQGDHSGILGFYTSSGAETLVKIDPRLSTDMLDPNIVENLGETVIPLTVANQNMANWMRNQARYKGPIAYLDENGQYQRLRD